MSESLPQPPEWGSSGATGKAIGPGLLMDQFLPAYDFVVVHAHVVRAPTAQCYRLASEPLSVKSTETRGVEFIRIGLVGVG